MAVVAKKEKSVVVEVVSAAVSFCFAVTIVMADLPRLEHAAKSDGSISFLVVGDWGRDGHYNQSHVAFQMGEVGERMDIDFVVSTGDNFYDTGLTDISDPQFQQSFTDVYEAKALQKQWYNVLGNHDYRGNVEAQLNPILTKIDARWICFRSFILNAEIVEILFVDTTPFVDKYFNHPKDETYDWSGILPRIKYLSDLLKAVDMALRESTAKWKIVVGHHTIKSSGHHGSTVELALQLLPILEANNVDLYINGHDHCLQHIGSKESGVQFLTSGGGSKAWKGEMKWWEPEEMKFYYDGQGFLSAHFTHDHVHIQFYDVFGKVLYKWGAHKPVPSLSHALQ